MAVFNGVANANNTFNGTDNVADLFNFATANLNNLDTIKGGGGAVVDILAFTTSGTILSASFAKVSGIEQIKLANGTNTLTVTNALVGSALGTKLAVIGGTGNDTIDGTALTSTANRLEVTLGTGNDTVRGGVGSDSFFVAASALSKDDTIIGGSGIDRLSLTTAGAISSASLAKVSGIEQITLANGTNSIALTNAMVTSALGTLLTVTGGTGNDTVDGSAVTSTANKLDIRLGAGNDSFSTTAAALTKDDVFDGGTGTDTLRFTTAGTISALNLVKVSGVEQITLANGTNSIALTNAMVTSALGTLLTVTGGTGNDTVDGSAVTSTANKLNVTLGTGNDTVKGGAGSDSFFVAASALTAQDTIIGGAGSDTLAFSTAATFSFAGLTAITQIEKLTLANGSNAIVLSNSLVGTANPFTVTGGTGQDTIDGSGVTATASRLSIAGGLGNDTLTGGAGADRISGGGGTDILDGGSNIDMLVVTGAADLTFDATLTDDQTSEDTVDARRFESFDGSAMTGKLTATGTGRGYTLIGGSGNDTLSTDYLKSYADGATLRGGGGSDRIEYNTAETAAGGLPLLDGEGGSDTLFNDYNEAIAINLSLVNADQTTGDLSNVRNFENVDWSSNFGNLTATGSTGVNSILGGYGNDRIGGNGGADTLDGGEGTDTLVATGASDLVIDLRVRDADQTSGDTATVRNFESIDGSAMTGNLTATAAGSVYGGGAVLIGGSGDDTLMTNYAEAYGDGAVLRGGGGDDRIEYNYAGGLENPQFPVLDGESGSDTLFGGHEGTLQINLSLINYDQTTDDESNVRNFENVDWTGSSGALVATGSAGANTIIGGDAGDSLSGGDGNDRLTGNAGSDTLTGGSGSDTFVFLARGENADSIADFGGTGRNADRLEFAKDAFSVNTDVAGFTTVLDTTTFVSSLSLDGVDLLRVSADALANPAAVNSFLSTKAVGDADQGLFIVATNSFDQVLLYYTAHASGPDVDAELIANLGTEVDVLDIQTNDFFFV